MHRTIFSTPVVNTVLRAFSLAFLRTTGWKIEGALPAHAAKCVLIAAPHTSNWDLPYTLMVAFALRLNIYWMGKHSLFRPPFGAVMRWLGGISAAWGRCSRPAATWQATWPRSSASTRPSRASAPTASRRDE